ncbi:MAG: NAD(P)-dependent oxidoreductase [Chitinophagales bacterium]|nr:NAD(P)-dependent oxidoreductase [Chitinophagales bacterium]
MKPRIILTGVSGFLGHHLIRIAAENWDVYGIYNTTDLRFEKATLLQCSITNYIELGNLFEDINPDAVIHTAAIADANFCEHEKELSCAVNVEATKNLAGICSDYKIPFAFTSTDLVFDGLKGNYIETDEKNPLSVYGEQKALAEDAVLDIYPEAVVFRLPLMFGVPEASNKNYLNRFLAQLRKGEQANLFTDEFRSVCGARSISKGILQLLNQSGIIHLAGKEKLSRYDFGLKAAEAFQLDKTLLNTCSQKDIKMAATRPPDVSLNISKALHLGYAPMSVDDELALIAASNYI